MRSTQAFGAHPAHPGSVPDRPELEPTPREPTRTRPDELPRRMDPPHAPDPVPQSPQTPAPEIEPPMLTPRRRQAG